MKPVGDRIRGVREWSPTVGLVATGWVAAVAAAGWCAVLVRSGADPAGQLIAGVAALGLGTAAAFGTLARPRLRVDADGLTIGGMVRSRHHPWPLVREVRVLRMRRLGRMTSLLEIDTVDADGHDGLLVFGRLELDADPEDVAAELLALRP